MGLYMQIQCVLIRMYSMSMILDTLLMLMLKDL